MQKTNLLYAKRNGVNLCPHKQRFRGNDYASYPEGISYEGDGTN